MCGWGGSVRGVGWAEGGKGEGGGGCGWDVSDVVVFWGEAKWVMYSLV